MTPIERATRALIDELHRQGEARGVTVEDNGKSAQVDGAFPVEPLCRAVIAAIREPGEGMLDAGSEVINACIEQGEPTIAADAAWQAMLDKLLEDSAP